MADRKSPVRAAAYRPDDDVQPVRKSEIERRRKQEEEDWLQNWILRIGFYLVYYLFLYILFVTTVKLYSKNFYGIETPHFQTRLESPRMRIFPVDWIREADFVHSASHSNVLVLGSPNEAAHKGDKEYSLLQKDWTMMTMAKAYETEFSEHLDQIQAQIDAHSRSDCSVSSGSKEYCTPIHPSNATHTYKSAVEDFCGTDALEFKNNKACFFVGITSLNGWQPIGLSSDWKMGEKMHYKNGEKVDQTLGDQLDATVTGDSVYFGCRLLKTKADGDLVVKNNKVAPYPLSEGSNYISWMDDQNFIPSYYWPKTTHNPVDHETNRNDHRFKQTEWYRPELVMKIDLSAAPDSISFDCNAYANNIKTPMLFVENSMANWYSRGNGMATMQPHQSFTFVKS